MLMNLFINIIFVLLIILIIQFCWSRRHLYVASYKLNGPMYLVPFIGNAHYFLCKNEEILNVIYSMSKKFASPFRFWLGPQLLVFSSKPDHVEKFLSSTKFAYKHDIYRFVSNFLGNGLVTASGPTYKKHRRIIQPIIDLKFTRSWIESIQRNSVLCIKKLEEHVDSGTFDIHLVTHKCFVDIISECFLGQNLNSQKNGYNDFCKAAIEMYNLGFTRLTRPWIHPDFIYDLTSLKVQETNIIKSLRNFVSDIVTKSWQRRKLKENYIVNESSPFVDQLGEFIEQNPNTFSTQDFIDHMITIFAAAEDTMTIITSYVAVCLGMYPEYQKKAAEEIFTIFGSKPREVTYDDILKLEYLDMCIKDVQRLCPIAPYILRKSHEEVYIDEELTIPANCCLVVPIFNVHRDAKHWENPLHFHPDHFLPEKVTKRHPYAFVPFSAGPRGCVGKVFANVCLKVFLCHLLQRYEIEADGKFPDLKLKMDISVRPLHGYNLRLKRRVWN